MELLYQSLNKKKGGVEWLLERSLNKQVPRGHTIVADGWARASAPPPPHGHLKRSFSRFLTHAYGWTERPTDQQTDGLSLLGYLLRLNHLHYTSHCKPLSL